MSPSISVLMPVYNAQRYVAQAVESILGQTMGDFEFLIVDDGSTDESLSILQGYAARDGRIRLISRPNTGYLVALNEMLVLARGELVARMDADDISLPARFERQTAYLRDHPDCVAVGSRTLLIDSEGLPICPWNQPLTHEEIDAEHLAGHGGAIAHPAAMFRASAIRAVGGYRAEFYTAEDLDLFLRLAEVGRLANLEEVLLRYRQHSQSIGYARRAEQARGAAGAVVGSSRVDLQACKLEYSIVSPK